MGLLRADLVVSNGSNGESVTVSATVDTGSFFSAVPDSLLRRIGLEPTESTTFEMADGSVIERGICDALTGIGERSGVSVVAFAADDVEPLIGAFTLERLRLMVDPAAQVLVPRELREIRHLS